MMERGRKTHASHAPKSATNDLLSIQRCKGTDCDLSPYSSQPGAPRYAGPYLGLLAAAHVAPNVASVIPVSALAHSTT